MKRTVEVQKVLKKIQRVNSWCPCVWRKLIDASQVCTLYVHYSILAGLAVCVVMASLYPKSVLYVGLSAGLVMDVSC